jgi:hypothetical protein
MTRHEDVDRRLAWELHVELASRISAVELGPDEGLLSEALNSLYSVFVKARQALVSSPPEADAGPDSVHAVAIRLMNKGLRPFLSRWHPALVAHQQQRPAGVSEFDHEQAWELGARLRTELADLQVLLREIARHLAERANAMSLLTVVS